MAETAARTGLILMPVFNYRFRKDSQLFKRYIEDENLGHIYFARVGWLRQQGIPAGAGSWFIDKNRSGGGCLIDLGVHMLDLSLWLMGQPQVLSVNAATYAALGPRERGLWGGKRFAGSLKGFNVEDFVTAFLRLENNTTLVLEVSWAGYTHWGDDFFIHLWGEEGGGELNVFRYGTKDTLRFFKDIHGARSETRPETEGHYEKDITSEFIRAIREGQAISPTVAEGLKVLRIIDAIYRSAEEGRQVDLV
jgi:predicted dehydrogenase